MYTTSTQIVPCSPDAIFLPVDISGFADGVRVPFDVYAKDKNLIKFLFSKNTVFCNIAREILALQDLNEFFIKKRDLTEYRNFIQMTASLGNQRGQHILFEEYSYYKNRSFVLRRNLITPEIAAKLRLGILRYPSFGHIPLMGSLTGDAIVEKIKNLEYDIVIPVSKLDAYEAYVRGLVDNSCFEKHIVRRELLKIKTHRFLNSIFNPDCLASLIEETKNMSDFIVDNKHLVVQMATSHLYDFYLYVHSVNVMLLSAVLGSNLGLPKHEITPLSIGALLHDIGKTEIADDVIDKSGNLSGKEYSVYQSYPLRSVEILRQMKDIPGEAMVIAMFHQEKLSDTGLKGKKVPLIARIVEIANAYDTIVSNKALTTKTKPFEALTILKKDKDNYDPSVLKAFIEIFN